jgi:hypothetical protein
MLLAAMTTCVIGCQDFTGNPSRSEVADSRASASASPTKASSGETAQYLEQLAADSLARLHGAGKAHARSPRQSPSASSAGPASSATLPSATASQDQPPATVETQSEPAPARGPEHAADPPQTDQPAGDPAPPAGGGRSEPDDRSSRSGAKSKRSSSRSREAAPSAPNAAPLSVQLRTPVALAQTLPNGTQMGFSVDYFLSAGSPQQGVKYFWVIRRGDGAQVAVPIGQLNDTGTLQTFVNWRPEEGPFSSYIAHLTSKGQPQAVSEVVQHPR